jgi:uncharacterized membrane protein YphA (DoxX/SURF4 family)
MRTVLTFPWLERLALMALCAAYIQGGLTKMFDLPAAISEQVRAGVPLPSVTAGATIVTELVGSLLIVVGLWRWLGALWLAGFTLVASLSPTRSGCCHQGRNGSALRMRSSNISA